MDSESIRKLAVIFEENHVSRTDIQCQICFKICTDPVYLPCKHAFCKLCVKSLAIKGGTSISCCKCYQRYTAESVVEVPPFFARYNEIAQQLLLQMDHPAPPTSPMENRGLRVPKRPLRYGSPEPPAVVTKRRRGKPLLREDVSLASASNCHPIKQAPMLAKSRLLPMSKLTAQMPISKVGSWLTKIPDEVEVTTEKVTRSKQKLELPLNRNGAVKGDLVEEILPRQNEAMILPDVVLHESDKVAAKKTSRPAVLNNMPGPPDPQAHNISNGNGDQSPGWSRVKKANKELGKHDQTLKALNISGGELSKADGFKAKRCLRKMKPRAVTEKSAREPAKMAKKSLRAKPGADTEKEAQKKPKVDVKNVTEEKSNRKDVLATDELLLQCVVNVQKVAPIKCARDDGANREMNVVEPEVQKQKTLHEKIPKQKHNSRDTIQHVRNAICKWAEDSNIELSDDEGKGVDLVQGLVKRISGIINPDPLNQSNRSEDLSDFAGFSSCNVSKNLSEASELHSFDQPTTDVVEQSDIVVAVPMPIKPRAVGATSKKLPANTSRKTFSLEADTQDLASIAINEDSFDKRISKIADANRIASKIAAKVGNSLTGQDKISASNDLKSSDDTTDNSAEEEFSDILKRVDRFIRKYGHIKNIRKTEFRDMRAFLFGHHGSFPSTADGPFPGYGAIVELDVSTVPQLVTVRREPLPMGKSCSCSCLCSVKGVKAPRPGESDGSGSGLDQKMAANKGTQTGLVLETALAVPLPVGKPCGCACLCSVKGMQAPQSPGFDGSECGLDQSMAANKGTPMDLVLETALAVPLPVLTQPDDSQDHYYTPEESFGSRHLGIKRLKSQPPVSACVKPAAGGDGALASIAEEAQDLAFGMERESGTLTQKAGKRKSQRRSKRKVVTKPVPKNLATSAKNKTLEKLTANKPNTMEFDVSDNDYIPDTYDPSLFSKDAPRSKLHMLVEMPTNSCKLATDVKAGGDASVMIRTGYTYQIVDVKTDTPGDNLSKTAGKLSEVAKLPAPQKVYPKANVVKAMAAIKKKEAVEKLMASKQRAKEAEELDEILHLDIRYPPELSKVVPRTTLPSEPFLVIGNNFSSSSKINETDKVQQELPAKPCPRSRKQTFERICQKKFSPKLTDPQISNTQLNNKEPVEEGFKTGSKKRFRRIRTESDSSGHGSDALDTVVISSDEDLPNRMSDQEEPDSLNSLLNMHCRNIPSPGFVGTTKKVATEVATPAMQADKDPEKPESFIEMQRTVSLSQRSAVNHDLTHFDNDVTHFDIDPEQNHQAQNVDDDEDYSEDMVNPTPEILFLPPKNVIKLPIRLAVAPPPEGSVFEGFIPATASALEDEVTVGTEAHILGSNLGGEDSVVLSRMIASVGATQDPQFTKATTHLVATPTANGCAPRTAKFICALASGAWVVSMDWVRRCIERDALLLGMRYELRDTKYDDSPRRSRLAGGRLLQDFAFVLMAPYSGEIDKATFTLILSLAGAKVVNDVNEKSNKKYLIALAQQEDSMEQKALNEDYLRECKTLTLAYTWVHTSICAFSLLPIWKHMPTDVAVPFAIRNRYPQEMFALSDDSDDDSDSSD